MFDCSAKFNGLRINDNLLLGPDLTNSLVGVLLRFRREEVAIQADVKSTFHQVRILAKNRDLLRFIWWKNGNVEDIKEYRMTVYPFGTASSPSCTNFALRRTTTDREQEYGAETIATACRGFYVDDCLTIFWYHGGQYDPRLI